MESERKLMGPSRLIILILCMGLLVNSVAPIASALVLNKAMALDQQDDALLLCTGGRLEWVSWSQFELTGELIPVEAPEGSVKQHKCPLYYFADGIADDALVSKSASPLIINTHDVPLTLTPIARLSSPERFFHSRAPPLS